MTPGTKHIMNSILAIERLFSCHVCMHGRHGELSFISFYHMNKACTFLKKKYPKIALPCYQFDSFTMRSAISRKHEPLLKICPAGFCEIVVPILINGWLEGWLFAGPFSPHESVVSECLVAPRFSGIKEKFELPVLNAEKADDLKALCLLLADAIASEIEHLPAPKAEFREMVTQYIRLHYNLNISMNDLSECTGLSLSHLSAKLNSEFKMSFRSLLNRERLSVAEKMLKSSTFPVVEIAQRCGFSEDKYFHRIFKKNYGITPSHYRLRHKQEP